MVHNVWLSPNSQNKDDFITIERKSMCCYSMDLFSKDSRDDSSNILIELNAMVTVDTLNSVPCLE